MDRKLATILVGDFVGSSAAMEADEERMLARVMQALDAVTACVGHHGGRVFNTAGDAVLAEFDSPVNALKAAIEARSTLASTGDLTPKNMRFGLHVADVVRFGDDLRGDGVNVAARLQQMAEPGEIDVSGALYDHVRRVSPCAFDDLGPHPVKGMSDPELHRIFGINQIRQNNDYEASRRHHEMALKLAPNDAYILGRCAAFYTFDGEPQRALDLLERADTLDPFLPVWIVEERVAALYAMGKYAEMNDEARSLNFQTRRSRLYRAAGRVARGDVDRAKALVREALADDPDLTTEYVQTQELFRDPEVLEELLARLRLAGLPDPVDGTLSLVSAR